MHILHLASWYPDDIEPYTGDFVQRHLEAVSLFIPVTVFHIAQQGAITDIEKTVIHTYKRGALTEHILHLRFKRSGWFFLDKLRFNWIYYARYKSLVKAYIRDNGLPALVHAHVPMKVGVMARWIKKTYQIPYIITEHSSAYYPAIPDNYFVKSRYHRQAVKKIYRDAVWTTVVSARLAKRLQELFGFRHYSVIHNVVNTALFNYSGHTPPVFRFIHASTMNHPKNVEGMLEVFAALKQQRTDWECVMLGWDTPALRKQCANLQLDGMVTWRGVVSYAQVAQEMRQSSALIMFSRYENFPCAIIEALCCGLPVIATRVGGIPEAVQANNGILVEPGNQQQLLNAMIQMMDTYGDYNRAQMATEAQARYNYQVVGRQLTDLYTRLCAEDAGSARG